mgnify:FL=1
MEEGAFEHSGFISRAGLRGLVGHVKYRVRALSVIFLLGFVISYPLTERMLLWASGNPDWRPEGVEIIIVQPMELILLKLKISVNLALGVTILAFVGDLSLNGGEVLSRARRSNIQRKDPLKLVLVTFSSISLGLLGVAYAHNILIPFLLEYLVNDSSSAGLEATWQIGSWLGFILGLLTASAVGFQVPLLAFVMIRSGILSPDSIVRNRSLLWFFALAAGAFLSPPDPLSMFLVGGPVVVLMELSIILERLTRYRDADG